DAKVISRFQTLLADKQVILADGHHRYTGSLAYRKEKIALNPSHSGKEAYNFHLMLLTNMESDDLRILPTHRLISGIQSLEVNDFLSKAEAYFIIKEIGNAYDTYEIILGKKWAFGAIFKDKAYKLRLKPESISLLSWNFPEEIKQLDLTVMHYFIIEKILGIP